jgi:hypothetical protein
MSKWFYMNHMFFLKPQKRKNQNTLSSGIPLDKKTKHSPNRSPSLTVTHSLAVWARLLLCCCKMFAGMDDGPRQNDPQNQCITLVDLLEFSGEDDASNIKEVQDNLNCFLSPCLKSICLC